MVTEDVLDAAQLLRIEAVHRGFLFQHLYAAQCLLSAANMSASSTAVETDEDVEVCISATRFYVQVKYRKDTLAWNDIESAISRFDELREAHRNGTRSGEAKFVIICNAAPNGPLKKRINDEGWPNDVLVDWPNAASEDRILPAPSASLSEAFEVIRDLANTLPFALLPPATLVWKLAGVVTLAATGDKSGPNHVFETDELPELFEQLVLQLQDLPSPPPKYRPQHGEPSLFSDERVRLIVGHSGAGKTSWLAQSAQHAVGSLIYIDIADATGASLASTVAREVAGRLSVEGQHLGELLLPGASGKEILQGLSRRIVGDGSAITVVLDNAHRVSSDDLIGVVKAGKGFQFVLLCRPESAIDALDTRLEITREELQGWRSDTVAAAAAETGCRTDAADCQRLIDLTGGLPLYVLNALVIAKEDYDGNVKQLCIDLASSAQTREMAQEVILGRVFCDLQPKIAEVADMLSLCDAPLTRLEIALYLTAAGGPDEAVFLRAVRLLQSRGLLQVFFGNKIKLHDAASVVGQGRLLLRSGDVMKTYNQALLKVVEASLLTNWSSAKLTLFLRLCGRAGRLDLLVEMASDELFHEFGVWPEIEAFLERGSQDERLPPDQRLKALDGLAFADLKVGSDRVSTWLDQMDDLITEHGLVDEERLRVGMKRMNFLAMVGDRKGAKRLIEELSKVANSASSEFSRIYNYNIAAAELALGNGAAAESRTQSLISEYFDLIGLKPHQVMGKDAPALRELITRDPLPIDDIKHLADTLDLHAKTMDAQGKTSPFARIHALKFYDLVQTPESMFRVGQDLVDQFIENKDFIGALEIMENILLPHVQQLKIAQYLIPIRSQYAVVLAYNGRFDEAEAEIGRLQPYESGLDSIGKNELINQRALITHLRRTGPPASSSLSQEALGVFAKRVSMGMGGDQIPLASIGEKKVGRNAACPCGSGKKYKKCHGG